MRDTLLIVAGDCGFGFDNPGYYDEMAGLQEAGIMLSGWVCFMGCYQQASSGKKRTIRVLILSTLVNFSGVTKS